MREGEARLTSEVSEFEIVQRGHHLSLTTILVCPVARELAQTQSGSMIDG